MVRKNSRAVTGIGFWALCAWLGAAELPELNVQVKISISAPTMVAALIQFSQQTGLQMVFPSDGATRMLAPKVTGTMTPRAALEELLKGSELTFEFVNDRTVSVRQKTAREAAVAVSTSSARP